MQITVKKPARDEVLRRPLIVDNLFQFKGREADPLVESKELPKRETVKIYQAHPAGQIMGRSLHGKRYGTGKQNTDVQEVIQRFFCLSAHRRNLSWWDGFFLLAERPGFLTPNGLWSR